MTVFETENEYFIIDYGILFPYEDFFDINYLIVDLSSLEPDKKTILFFSHGHEDHIGAVTHIVGYFTNVQFWAPRFATALIRKKLGERNIAQKITTYREEDIKSLVEKIYKYGKKTEADEICNTYGSRGIDFLRDIYEKCN